MSLVNIPMPVIVIYIFINESKDTSPDSFEMLHELSGF